MGILDILNGMMNGPRGPAAPQQQKPGGGGGMSPITLALLALLAYKAWQHMGSGKTAPDAGGSPFPLPNSGETTASGGGLGDILGQVLGGGKGGMPGTQANSGGLGDLLGGILGGGAAGGILSGGLDQLLKQMQQQGQGKVADSWIGTGQNQQIAPNQLESVLGKDVIDALMRQTGESKGSVLADLAKDLPNLVDMLTPGGKVPTEKELSRFL
jgi:uncharacterized protein YidB (DUF937 family)